MSDPGDELMKRMFATPPPPRSPRLDTVNALRDVAAQAFNELRDTIKEFEGRLGSRQEVGLCLVSTAGGRAFHAETIEYRAGLFIFSGLMDGQRVCLVQHHTQVSVLLTPVDATTTTPRRIGFITPKEQVE